MPSAPSLPTLSDQYPVIVVSSDLENRRSIARMLLEQGFEPAGAASVSECREVLDQHEMRVVFCDRDLQDGDYRDVLAAALYAPHKNKAHVVLMSSLMRPEDYQEARRAGIFHVVGLPCRSTNLEWAIILAKRDERNRAKELLGMPSSGPTRAKAAMAGVR
jgi:DNA-binding NtrC family response regulator